MTVGSVGKRKAERRDCQVKAQVLLPDAEAADAVILNFSATGARARLAAPLDLPARFKLFIPSRPETKSVLLRWRNGLEFGCEYSTGLADEDTLYELVTRVERLEAAGGGEPVAADAPVADMARFERQIAALENRIETVAAAPSPAAQPEGASDPKLERRVEELEGRIGLAAQAADVSGLDARIDKVGKLADDRVRGVEAFLVSRMDQLEERLRTAFAPDVAERLARLEALAEAGTAEVRQDATPTSNAPDQALLARIADIEARLMEPRPTVAPAERDLSAVERQIARVEKRAEEQTARAERFINARMDEIEAQLISAPAAPATRRPDIESLERQMHDLTRRFEEAIAFPQLDELEARLSNLEVSAMELRADMPVVDPEAADIGQRLAQIEERHGEIVATLRNLLALLSARDERRAAS